MTSNYIMSHRPTGRLFLIKKGRPTGKASGFSHRRRQTNGFRKVAKATLTGVSAETMKTTTVNTRTIVNTIAASSQRGYSGNQRKPGYYQLVQRQPVLTVAAPKGPSFREILERELGPSTGSKANGSVQAGQGAKAAGQAESETTQFLTGYWA